MGTGKHKWLRTEPAMLHLRKFCAGLEYTVDRAMSDVNPAGLERIGLHMYADPTGDFCFEPDCDPRFAAEVPYFHADAEPERQNALIEQLHLRRPTTSACSLLLLSGDAVGRAAFSSFGVADKERERDSRVGAGP